MSLATATKSPKGEGDEWLTPLDLWEEIRLRYFENKRIYDPCPSKVRQLPGCFSFNEPDGLKTDWSGKQIFVNPPFSDIEPWMKKANEQMSRPARVLMLIPVRADQPWWHDYALRGCLIFIRGRVNYERPKKKKKNTGASFASCLVLFDGTRGVDSWWPACHVERKRKHDS